MVPRLIHQIWIDPDPAPFELIDTWRTAHPAWQHRLWGESDLNNAADLG